MPKWKGPSKKINYSEYTLTTTVGLCHPNNTIYGYFTCLRCVFDILNFILLLSFLFFNTPARHQISNSFNSQGEVNIWPWIISNSKLELKHYLLNGSPGDISRACWIKEQMIFIAWILGSG